ncbi:peptidase M6, partial [Nakamurella silvestris]
MGATSAIASTTALTSPVALPAIHAAPVGLANGLDPVDPQTVDNLDDLDWDDFKPIPNTDWANPALQPTVKKWKAAIVLLDYPDVPFLVTQPQGSTIWGNPGPQGHDIPRAQVPQFYKDFLNTPNASNNYHTINEYWMEDTAGRYGVEMTAFGVYQMPKKSYQYFYSSYGNSGTNPATKCPAVLLCNGNLRTDGLAAWKAATGLADPAADFDNVFYLGAGADQSSVWLEFGQKMFKTPEDVSDSFGPPAEWKAAVKAATGLDAPNYAPTRYVPWTSWAASAALWANASGKTSIESEMDGKATFAHEFSHNLSIGDNYGNPYAVNPVRDQSGAWDMMSRGSFNGPKGAHERWHVPSVLGDVMGAQHMLRDKMVLNFVPASSVVNVTRTGLATTGVAVTSVTARAVQLPGQKAGINVVLDGGDKSTCATNGDDGDFAWRCDKGNFNNYTLEVVDQMGSDSFTPDSGVLIAKTKNTGSPNKWVIDANPADINMIDYYQADGTPVKLTRGDHRQLNDALFHAGSDSGSQFEYTDAANNLQFYILNPKRDAAGILSYDVAVRNTTA